MTCPRNTAVRRKSGRGLMSTPWGAGHPLSGKEKQRILGKEKTQLEVSEKSSSQGNREGRLEGEAGRRCQGEMEAVSFFLLGLP